MDENLKPLLEALRNAINESFSELSGCDRVTEAVGAIRKAGYDVFLMMEATIGLNKSVDEPEAHNPAPPLPTSTPPRNNPLTAIDKNFLRKIKISPW